MKLYGFKDDGAIRHMPSYDEIQTALKAIGSHNIAVNENDSTIFLNDINTKLDFGGIAVGYAIDKTVSILRSHGIESALINHSGDIYAIGSPADDNFGKIGIIDPTNQSEIVSTINLKDEALATSGNYNNFVMIDESRVGHIMNPMQTVVALVTITLFVPCITSILIMYKERGWKTATIIWIGTWIGSFTIGGIVAHIIDIFKIL